MKKLNLGLIGLGKRSRIYKRLIQRLNNARIACVCDVKNRNVDKSPNEAIYYKDYKKLIKENNVDAVIIVTPNSTHYKIIKDCLEANKHVLCEKPFLLNLKGFDYILSKVKKKNLVVRAGHHLRYDSLILKMKKLIESNQIGKIFYIRARQAHDWGSKKPNSWLINKKVSGGGTLLDNGIHYLDLFSFFNGDVKEIHAFTSNKILNYSVEDNSLVTLKFFNGSIGELETSWTAKDGRTNEIIIYGTKMTLKYREIQNKKSLTLNKYFQNGDGWNFTEEKSFYVPKGIERISKKIDYESLDEDPTFLMVKDFVSDIINNNPNIYKLEEVRKSIELVMAAYDSVKKRKNIIIK